MGRRGDLRRRERQGRAGQGKGNENRREGEMERWKKRHTQSKKHEQTNARDTPNTFFFIGALPACV